MFKSPLLPLLLLAALSLPGRAAFYIEPRLSAFTVGGTPALDDGGFKTNDDLPRAAFGLVAGWEINPRLCAELRYTAFDGFTIAKRSPHWPVTAPGAGDIVLPMVVDYDYEQSTDLVTFGVPIRVAEFGKFTVSAAPLVHFEHSRIRLTQLVNIAAATSPIVRTTFRTETVDTLRLGGELALAYRVNERVALRVHYAFHDLSHADLHQLGAGAVVGF